MSTLGHFCICTLVAHPDASIYTPGAMALESAQALNIDIVGEKDAVDAAVGQVRIDWETDGETKEITIDGVIHCIISGKYTKKCINCIFYIFDTELIQTLQVQAISQCSQCSGALPS